MSNTANATLAPTNPLATSNHGVQHRGQDLRALDAPPRPASVDAHPGKNGLAPSHIFSPSYIAKFSLLQIEVDDRHRALISAAYELGLKHGGYGK